MPKFMNKRSAFFYAFIVFLALGLIAGARYYASESQAALAEQREEGMASARDIGSELRRVKVFRPFPMNVEDVLSLPGTVEASRDIELASTIGGTVAEIAVSEGDRTEAGQTLLKLDMRTEEAQLREAQINFALAQGNRADMERLFGQSIISRSERNEAVGVATRAQAIVEQQQARVNEGRIKSPIAGIVDLVDVDEGEHINAGQTVMRIVDIDRVKVVLNIPEKDIAWFRGGQQVHLSTRINGSECKVEGAIEHVTLTADPVSRTYPVKVIAENPERLLRPGMIVSAELVRRSRNDAIALPFFSVIDRESGPVVFVVEDGEAQQRPVETRAIQGGIVEIASGLEADEAVVVVGQRSLVDGEKVEIVEDLTESARAMIAQGVDVSRLPLELAP